MSRATPAVRFRQMFAGKLPARLWQGANQEWEEYGRLDPYFGVVSHSRFHSGQLDRATLEDFFASGARHVEEVFGVIHEQMRADFRPGRALDFGCGVGRITIPLARMCASVVGVDISESMLKEARKNCDSRGIGNVELFPSDDMLSAVAGTFDFIHSFIVLQHIPPRQGELLIRTLLDRLSEGGIAVLQLTYHRRASGVRRTVHWMRRVVPLVNGLVNVMQGRALRYPLMDMYNYDVNRVLLILQELGCSGCHMRFTDHGGHLGVVVYLVKGSLANR